jgi:hypothetical protein
MTTFNVGQSYSTRSICDSNCVFSLKVLARTAKTITVQLEGAEKKLRVFTFDECEAVRPFGNYSMAPTIRAR